MESNPEEEGEKQEETRRVTDKRDAKGQRERKNSKRVEKGWVHDLYRVQIAINLSLLSKVRNRRSDAITIRSNILLNSDTDLCPRSSCRCKPISFLNREKKRRRQLFSTVQ